MATSDNQDDAKPLKTDRRVTLDGGLNTRSSCLNVQSNEATALGNFRLTSGALQKRKGGAQLCTINPFPATTSMLAPVLTDAGAGTLAAGTYTIGYTLGTVSSASGVIGMSPTAVIVIAANHNINILIPSPNSGEGFGSLTTQTFLDEPQNGGSLLSGPNFAIYVKKTGDPNFTAQVVGDSGSTPLGPPPTPAQNGHLFLLSVYSSAGSVAPVGQLAPVPVRFLFWYPLIDTLIGVSGTQPYALQGNLTSPQYMALSNDSLGLPFGFSQLPTRITPTVIDRCLILSDAVGRPKILDSPLSLSQQYGITLPTSWSFRQLGAAAGKLAPTRGALVGGALTGTYQYVYTLVYSRNRQDGTSFLSESNSSPALTVVYAAQQATISIAAPLESGIISWNLYRTIAGGTQFFLAATNVIAQLSVSDNLTDVNLALLSGQQPPDMGGKLPNDLPPQGLAQVTEFGGQGFGVVSNVLRKAGGGSSFCTMVRTRATNIVQYSKVRFVNDLVTTTAVGVGISGFINTLPGDYGNIDAWPSFQTFPCGNSSAITNLVSFRGVLYVFKEDEIGVVEGTPGDFNYRTIWVGSGAMENSIIQIGNYLLAFDQALGPVMVSGYSVQNVGYDGIQLDWQKAVAILNDEAITGGSRGSTAVISKIWDTFNSEARWVISNYQTDPTSAIAKNTTPYSGISQYGVIPVFFEYVCQVPKEQPSGQFTRFTGASSQFGFYGTSTTPQVFAGLPFIFVFQTQAGLSFAPGNFILMVNPADQTNFAFGIVGIYSGTTLTVNVITVAGNPAINSFNIVLSTQPTVDRRIMAQAFAIVGTTAVPFRARDLVYGDWHGRLVEDYQNEFDLNGVLTAPISMRATFPFFFGDDPEKVKQFRYLYAMTTMGTVAADVMNIITQSLSKDVTAPLSMASIPGGQAPAGINRLQHIPFLPTLDGTTSKDRGVQIVISGSAASGPTSIQELTVKYQDAGYRSKP